MQERALLKHHLFCREQLSRSTQRASGASSSGQQATSGVSPEFLAALPPNIQEEVLEQERRERVSA